MFVCMNYLPQEQLVYICVRVCLSACVRVCMTRSFLNARLIEKNRQESVIFKKFSWFKQKNGNPVRINEEIVPTKFRGFDCIPRQL